MEKKRRGTRAYNRLAPNPKVSVGIVREIKIRLGAGQSKAAIARALGIHRTTVWRVLKEFAPELIKGGKKE